jgi:O-antigen ligase
VSSLATARPQARSGPPPPSTPARRPARAIAEPLAIVALAGALTAVTFTTGGGVVPGSDAQLSANTWTEIALVLLAALGGGAVLLWGRPAPRWGAGALLAFAALVAFTAASIGWSVAPGVSWRAADQALSYLAAFAAAACLARLLPGGWRALLGALAVAAVVPSGWALLVKVFPATLDAGARFGRLSAPLDYWNATGCSAALGLTPCLWWAARRESRAIVRAVAVAAIALLGSVLILSYSRSALAAAVLGCAAFFVLAPLRLRGALALLIGILGAAPICAWALAHRALSGDQQRLAARDPAGHTFGVVIVLSLLVCGLVAWAALRAAERRPPRSERARRRTGIALLCLLALVPLAGIGALAHSRRGFTGEISHLYEELTSQTASVGNSASRLGTVANSRPRYWHEGIAVFDHAVLKGVGALGFQTAAVRYRGVTLLAGEAHSYVVQTLADLGLIGLVASLLLLAGWGRAAVRTLGGLRGPPPTDAVPRNGAPAGPAGPAAERAGLVALLAVALAFGLQSAVDWTWFIPALALPALIAAGWIAGRGPLASPAGALRTRRRLLSHPRLPLLASGIALAALGACYAIWQPLRAERADASAISAAAGGHLGAALADAREAVSYDPLSTAPREELASLDEAAGRYGAGRSQLAQELAAQRGNWQAWFDLGHFDLLHGNLRAAVFELRRARALNRYDVAAFIYYRVASGELRKQR